MRSRTVLAAVSTAALMIGAGLSPAAAQGTAPASVGFGAPQVPLAYPYPIFNTNQAGETVAAAAPATTNFSPNAATLMANQGIADCAAAGAVLPCMGQGPANGTPPPGVEALPVDIFTSTDYYLDRDLWEDPRYYRCNGASPLSYAWGALPGGGGLRLDPAIGASSARWGDCQVDYPREAIVSPYPFATAQEHYEALLAEARANGGPTVYTYSNPPPDWNGNWNRANVPGYPANWLQASGAYLQPPTQLSLLTEEYKYHQMQEWYHAAHDGTTHWPAQYCWPEGFMRRYHGPAVTGHQFFMTAYKFAIIAGVADNFFTEVVFNREFNMAGVAEGSVPRLGSDVRKWYGETIGFWNGRTLITWTSNVQGWMTHDMPEHSSALQTIEIYYEIDENRIRHESIFYDPLAYVEPLRVVRDFIRAGGANHTMTPYVYIECNPTIHPVAGRAEQTPPGTTISYTIPSWFERPWAQFFALFEAHMRTDLSPSEQARRNTLQSLF